MMEERQDRLPPLEEGLLRAMQALDGQIRKEIGKRAPDQLEEQGVQKWLPYERRIERISAFVLSALGDNEIGFDSLLVLSQALTKSLQLVVGDLGTEGLGEVRTAYCARAMTNISRDADIALQALSGAEKLV